MGRRSACLLLGLALGCGAAPAAPQDQEIATVHVTGIRDLKVLSYRTMLAGLDAFDAYHQQLAPAAPPLRFRILTPLAAAGEPELAMRIASDDASFPVAVDADGRFALPRIREAYDGRAGIVVNRKKRAFRITPEFRTAGLPGNVRRLGDLRLECKVLVAMAKEEMPFWINATVDTLLLSTDWCPKMGDKLDFASPLPLAAATLRDADRTLAVKTGKSAYRVPLGDASWSNDALVEFSYESEHDVADMPADKDGAANAQTR